MTIKNNFVYVFRKKNSMFLSMFGPEEKALKALMAYHYTLVKRLDLVDRLKRGPLSHASSFNHGFVKCISKVVLFECVISGNELTAICLGGLV